MLKKQVTQTLNLLRVTHKIRISKVNAKRTTPSILNYLKNLIHNILCRTTPQNSLTHTGLTTKCTRASTTTRHRHRIIINRTTISFVYILPQMPSRKRKTIQIHNNRPIPIMNNFLTFTIRNTKNTLWTALFHKLLHSNLPFTANNQIHLRKRKHQLRDTCWMISTNYNSCPILLSNTRKT